MEQSTIPLRLRAPRTTLWLLIAAVLLAAIGVLSPVQLPVVLYKAALIALAAVLGYWLDRVLFPYARPDSYLHRDWRCREPGGHSPPTPDGEVDFPVVPMYLRTFNAAMLRRAVVVGAVVLGVATGL